MREAVLASAVCRSRQRTSPYHREEVTTHDTEFGAQDCTFNLDFEVKAPAKTGQREGCKQCLLNQPMTTACCPGRFPYSPVSFGNPIILKIIVVL